MYLPPMLLDLLIVLTYFAVVMAAALRGRQGTEATTESYFLSNRNLRWPSIAISTIATNVQGYQFLGMMGSAYLYGLAQANLEINAVQGMLLAAFVFVPMYLRNRVITITQFIQDKLGEWTGVLYSVANLLLLSTVGLGAALFWGAYAADLVFADYLVYLSEDRLTRTMLLVAGLGVFAAIYTYFGGLSAVVKTDIIQFGILLAGGITVLGVAIYQLGGFAELYRQTPELMHLHLPADHPTLPWIAIGGMFLLNINYWCANQTVVQRSLAARSLREAQIGLMVGGVMKYVMAAVVILPGIALVGLVGKTGLAEPDQAFPYLVTTYLPAGIRGIILCALFASLMSTVDSTFNSLATLFSVDIYKPYINPEATDAQLIRAGRRTILVTLLTGVSMGCLLLYVKLANPEVAFTHTLNEYRYYINCGIVVTICAAAVLAVRYQWLAVAALLSTIPLHLLLQSDWAVGLVGELNYFVRAMWVILIAFGLLALSSLLTRAHRFPQSWFESAGPGITKFGWGLLASLALLHWIFH